MITVFDNRTEWYNALGQLHRENDLPAIVYNNGDKVWRVNDVLHRETGAACELSDGTKWWYLNDVLLSEEEFYEHLYANFYYAMRLL